MIDCEAFAHAGCYCVSSFEKVVVAVPFASHPLDVTLQSVEMLRQWVSAERRQKDAEEEVQILVGLWVMKSGSASTSDSRSVVTLWNHTVNRSIHQVLLVEFGEEAEVDEVIGQARRMRLVLDKWLVMVQRRRNDVGCSKGYSQRDCRVADLRHRLGSPYCTLTGCTVVTEFARTAEGCRSTGAEVSSGVVAAVDSLTGLDHT